MSEFNKVIGYESIKKELMQINDMVQNPAAYEALGAKIPRGVLLHGEPGLGKTLMMRCLIKECGINTYTVRRNKGTDDFVSIITSTFEEAKNNAPSIVFLDDLDKFANEDDSHRDAEEYVAVQSGIDHVKEAQVIVLATANDMYKLPDSLLRAGRFDRKILVNQPTLKDAEEIIEYYLSDKKVSEDIDIDDLSKMMNYSSCAELETVLNEAAVYAGENRRDCIAMEDVIEAVLKQTYSATDIYTSLSDEEIRKNAIHEAGHAVVCDSIYGDSVGLISIRKRGRSSCGGFMHRFNDDTKRSKEIMIYLAGKVAVEMYFADICASGCQGDLNKACSNIVEAISSSGFAGMGFINVESSTHFSESEQYLSRMEAAAQAELERYTYMTKDILIKNRAFLEALTEELIKKETLLHSDIVRIKESISQAA